MPAYYDRLALEGGVMELLHGYEEGIEVYVEDASCHRQIVRALHGPCNIRPVRRIGRSAFRAPRDVLHLASELVPRQQYRPAAPRAGEADVSADA